MKRKIVGVLILGLMMGAQLAAADPQPEKANWDNLKQLLPGEEIRVVLNDAKSFRGLLQTVTDEGIAVRLATGEQTFARQNILRVSSRGRRHRLRNMALGAAAGAGVGAPIGVHIGNKQSEGAVAVVDFLIVEAIAVGIGLGTGAALPTGGWHDVYRAR